MDQKERGEASALADIGVGVCGLLELITQPHIKISRGGKKKILKIYPPPSTESLCPSLGE